MDSSTPANPHGRKGAKPPHVVVSWSDDKARRFIRDLTAHACQPAFQYRHQWRVGDAVLWDNRRVLHAGTVYDMERETRLMHRTTLQEAELV